MKEDSQTNSGMSIQCVNKKKSYRLLPKIIKGLIWYVLGILTPFLILAFLIIIGIRPPKSKTEILVEKWGLNECKECNDTLLLINVPSGPNVHFTLGIERDDKTSMIKQIGITRVKDKSLGSSIFLYKERGKFGIPMAYYGFAEQGMIWRDLNFDSQFDQIIDYKNKKMEININGHWIQGTGTEEVNTEIGSFMFDPNIGEWKPILTNMNK